VTLSNFHITIISEGFSDKSLCLLDILGHPETFLTAGEPLSLTLLPCPCHNYCNFND